MQEIEFIKVYSTAGSIVQNFHDNFYSNEIDISTLPNGVYFLNIKLKNGLSNRFVIQKQ
jgi:hypothetical protein